MKRNQTIDAGRLLAAILVVIFHGVVFNIPWSEQTFENLKWFYPISNLAVPFFFMVTGFFLSDQKEEGILRQAWSHFKLYALYFPLFSIFTLLRAWALDLQGLAPMKEVIGEQMTLSNFFNGTFPALHLWYLLAGALALWLFYSLRRFKLPSWLITLFSLLIWFVAWESVEENVFWDTHANGGVWKALSFIALGHWMGTYRRMLFPSLFFLVLTSVPYYKVHQHFGLKSSWTNLMLFLTMVAFFPILAVFPGKDNPLSRWGRDHSFFIYMYHPLVIYTYATVVNEGLRLQHFGLQLILLTIFSVAVSVILGKYFDPWYRRTMKSIRKVLVPDEKR